MYCYFDTLDGNFIENLLPDNFNEEILEDFIFIEAELMDLSAGKTEPDPKLGIKKALASAQDGSKIMLIAEKDYPELNDWQDILKLNNVAICYKHNITKKSFLDALNKVI